MEAITNKTKLSAIKNFEQSQTLTKMQHIKNMGVSFKEIKNNTWADLNTFKLPLNRLVPLYNDQFIIYAIGIY